MAKKYLKYFVTRDNQKITAGFMDYMVKFPKDKHIFNIPSIHSWHLYEMFQNAFYCNWPNTSLLKYFIQAEPIILRNQKFIESGSHEYFGILFINPTTHKLVVEVDDEVEQIDITPGLLFISPHNNETYSIVSGGNMLAIKFIISSTPTGENWIPF